MQKLDSLRSEIDAIDKKLLQLLSERFIVVEQVWRLKQVEKMPALQQDRWDALLKRLKEQWREYNIPPGCIENIWNEIHNVALDKENEILNTK